MANQATGDCIKARFMNNNLCCNATLSASSEAAGFGVENLKDENRSKSWVGTGHFEVVDGVNDSFFYNDGVTQKSLTIFPTSQPTGQAFAAELEAQLNGRSGFTGWTVSYSDITYKFTIAHPTLTLRFSSYPIDAIWPTLGYTTNVDTAIASGYEAQEPRIHTSEYIDIEAGAAAWDVGFVGLVGSLGQVMSMSDSAVVKIMANNVPVWTSPPLEVIISRNDQGYLAFLDEGTNYKYWRLDISDPTNTAGPSSVSASYLYVGNYLTFTTTNIATGFNKQIVDPSDIQETQSGRRYFNRRTKYEVFNNLAVQLPEQSERLAWEQFVYEFGLTAPFFISIDPGLKISAELAELTKFVYFASLPPTNHIFYNRYNLGPFNVREVI